MSQCTITQNFKGTAEDLFSKIKTQIEDHGGTINGDASAGSFSVSALGTISGTYTISGQTLTIVITKKPGIISCGVIEHFVSDHLG